MHCPVEMISPFLTFDINGMHRKRAAFVSPTILYSTISLYIIKDHSYNVIRELGELWTSTTHENTHTIKIFFASKDMTNRH